MRNYLIVLILIFVITFTGCSNDSDSIENISVNDCSNDSDSIKSISINDKTYHTIYLYSYSDAKLLNSNVDLPSEIEQHFLALAKDGYFLSRSEYKIGEFITVDFSCFYGEDGLNLSNEDYERFADEKVNVSITEVTKRAISVREKEDTFVISYSEINSLAYDVNNNDSYIYRRFSSLSQDKERLNEIVDAIRIETVKENVVIFYDSQS